jgi:hypothetical protein
VFVLSRRIGESVVIGNSIVATVAVVGTDFVDLSLVRIDGTRLGKATLDRQLRPVVPGVAGVIVKRLEGNRVSLGFELEDGIPIVRSPH